MKPADELAQLKKKLQELKEAQGACSAYIHPSAIKRLQEIEELEYRIGKLEEGKD